jgi:hypothetical protein
MHPAIGLQEESSFQEWEDAMGQDSVHLTEKAYGKLAEGIFQMSEDFEALFSGGKREGGVAGEAGPNPHGKEAVGVQQPCCARERRRPGRSRRPWEGRGGYKPGSHAGGYGFSPAGGYSGYAGNKR